ncbi:polysaccharide pyruvyl transferase family protein [Peribacillus butanolivorans]|uniref:polysaccharide pyruvyl transferase family protein n=1 Tax=Peribacillus butanolivorans TaxID=421767 RepID=UPI0035DA2121
MVKRYKINRFVKSNMELTSKTFNSNEELKNANLNSNLYIVGSDQVWNSQLSEGQLDPAYFLDFTDSNNKIAFSSSIGRTDVNVKELNEMKKYLDGFLKISVREQSAKQLLEGAGVKNVTNVLDPVFLLKKEDYVKYIKPVKYEKYLLIYSFEKNPVLEKIALEISRELNLKIIEIGIFKSKYKCDKYVQNGGIEDFLSLIYFADFIITSSFHGTAFSILLNKQFISVAPSIRRTRLENITNLFEVSDRLISDEDNYILKDLLNPIKYEKINELLVQHSKKSQKFLEEAIELIP